MPDEIIADNCFEHISLMVIQVAKKNRNTVMENKIPIPTDNIFKFYALFGLMLFIFGTGSIVYVTRSTNELVFRSVTELVELGQAEKPSPVDAAKRQMIEKRLEVAAADRKFFQYALGGLVGIGFVLMCCGFQAWHTKVQPMQDEAARLQLEKLRHEIKQLKRSSSEVAKPEQQISPQH